LAIQTLVKRSEYHDSVTLMLVARDLSHMAEVEDAAVVMATEANKGLLKNAGLLTPEAESATPDDLVIAVKGAQSALGNILTEAEKLLHRKQTGSATSEFRPKTLGGAVKADPGANVAVISVAGRFAAAEAWEALSHGLHVLLFSDNVSLEDEIALKRYAVEHGLLLMGPGAGTAILNGVALGFANVVPRGPVGIVAAAGTGLQEVSSLLAKYGAGLSQGIGTGGRDLKEEVGGLMMLAGLKALQDDPDTKVIVLVSKPPSASVAKKMLEQTALSEKTTVVCFLGGDKIVPPASLSQKWGKTVFVAQTLEKAALLGAQATGIPKLTKSAKTARVSSKPHFAKNQRCLRGLFSGGTLCYEAQVIWRDILSEPVFSNAPLDVANQLPDSLNSQGHTVVDLGEEEFTVGRPHPMIDNDLRIRRLFQEAHDSKAAVIMLDVVLGYGAHPDPASELAPAVQKAREIRRAAGGELLVVASVTGTDGDPQGMSRQVSLLEQAGVIVCESNAAAARLVAEVVKKL
jgi:succinyl-CoA synthetase alpha subunit